MTRNEESRQEKTATCTGHPGSQKAKPGTDRKWRERKRGCRCQGRHPAQANESVWPLSGIKMGLFHSSPVGVSGGRGTVDK